MQSSSTMFQMCIVMACLMLYVLGLLIGGNVVQRMTRKAQSPSARALTVRLRMSVFTHRAHIAIIMSNLRVARRLSPWTGICTSLRLLPSLCYAALLMPLPHITLTLLWLLRLPSVIVRRLRRKWN